MPTLDYGNECGHLGEPFIQNCDYDGAGIILKVGQAGAPARQRRVTLAAAHPHLAPPSPLLPHSKSCPRLRPQARPRRTTSSRLTRPRSARMTPCSTTRGPCFRTRCHITTSVGRPVACGHGGAVMPRPKTHAWPSPPAFPQLRLHSRRLQEQCHAVQSARCLSRLRAGARIHRQHLWYERRAAEPAAVRCVLPPL